MFDRGDAEKLAKISIYSILDLALFIPEKYEDNRLTDTLRDGSSAVLELEILRVFKKGKVFRVEAVNVATLECIELIYFNTLPYHKAVLKRGVRGYFKGKTELKNKIPQLIQPKIITDIGGIEYRYPTKLLKKQTIRALVDRYLSLPSLLEAGLPNDVAQNILKFHFPTTESINFLLPPQNEMLYALKYTEIYNHINKLSKKRRDYQASQTLNNSPKKFIETLPFSLTKDQTRCIEDIQKDIGSKIAAKRIVVGDVGSGKSIVMFVSAFMALPHRSLIMAPTTVLANQLYNEAKKFLGDTLKIALYTQTQKDDIKSANLIIGTHALLYTELPEIHLIMVDEQHRFGTNQRYKLSMLLRQEEKRAHYLQFSATPIPRTKAMINSSLIDYSFIKEIPFEKNITTKTVHQEDFPALLNHIKKEISKNNQIAIIYPLVEKSENFNYQSIDEARGFWEKSFENVFVTHGRDKEKERVLEEFDKKGSILISTTVIEVGISLNRLSTIIIVGAERLGFSQLHQLRGRVGRIGLKGYCFLFTRSKNNKRLAEFQKTTSGFDIAELDLKFREGGDLLEGRKQSGKKYRYFNESEDFEILQRVKNSKNR